MLVLLKHSSCSFKNYFCRVSVPIFIPHKYPFLLTPLKALGNNAFIIQISFLVVRRSKGKHYQRDVLSLCFRKDILNIFSRSIPGREAMFHHYLFQVFSLFDLFCFYFFFLNQYIEEGGTRVYIIFLVCFRPKYFFLILDNHPPPRGVVCWDRVSHFSRLTCPRLPCRKIRRIRVIPNPR